MTDPNKGGQAHSGTVGVARRREQNMLTVLAEVVVHGFVPEASEEESELRQLGYAAFIARGRVDDPDDNLGQVVKYCRDRLADRPPAQGTYRDLVQQRWGAEWYLDLGKVRAELPLHVLRQKRLKRM